MRRRFKIFVSFELGFVPGGIASHILSFNMVTVAILYIFRLDEYFKALTYCCKGPMKRKGMKSISFLILYLLPNSVLIIVLWPRYIKS